MAASAVDTQVPPGFDRTALLAAVGGAAAGAAALAAAANAQALQIRAQAALTGADQANPSSALSDARAIALTYAARLDHDSDVFTIIAVVMLLLLVVIAFDRVVATSRRKVIALRLAVALLGALLVVVAVASDSRLQQLPVLLLWVWALVATGVAMVLFFRLHGSGRGPRGGVPAGGS